MDKPRNELIVTTGGLSPNHIQRRIITLRGVQVLLDRDLAELYGVPVKRLNEQVVRNIDRFPERFMFQLEPKEFTDLKSQIATSSTGDGLSHLKSQIATSSWGGVRKPPRVFTEQGVAMLSSVLNSKTAILVSIAIMDAFVKMAIITSEHYKRNAPHHQISDADIETFNGQYPTLTVRYNETFHDRFLIIDDKELYLIGASLKDLGAKCFGFTKMDSAEIPRIKKMVFATANLPSKLRG